METDFERERLAAIVEAAEDGIVGVSLDGLVTNWNRAAERIYGYAREEIVGTPWRRLVPPDRLHEIDQITRRVTTHGKVERFETVRVRKDGTHIAVSLSVVLMRRPPAAEPLGFVIVVRDLTDRDRVDAQLRLSESRLREAQRVAHIGSWENDLDNDVLTWSEETYRLFGVRPGEFTPTIESFLAMVHPDDRSRLLAMRRKVLATGGVLDIEHRIVGRAAAAMYVRERAELRPAAPGRPRRLVGTVQDVTEWRQMMDALRELSLRLESVQEEERAAIAREVHDDLGQALVALRMDMAQLVRPPAKASELRRRAREFIHTLDEAIERVRLVARALHPTVLDDLGLPDAIALHADQFQRRTGIAVTLEVAALARPVLAATQRAAFRVVQEALTNVARHARATAVRITASVEGRTGVLTVADNGVGISRDLAARPGSLGILGMRERAASVGGEVEVRPAECGGTEVLLRVPLHG